MSDENTTSAGEPFDQTNGVVDGLHGDDGGSVEPGEPDGLLTGAVREAGDVLSGDRDDDGATAEDADPARTPYGEEGAR